MRLNNWTKAGWYTVRVYIPAIARQTKLYLSIKISRNRESMSKMSPHVLSTSRKYTTGLLGKSFWGCCDSTVLTIACYWPSSHSHSCWEVCINIGGIKLQPFTVGVWLWTGCALSSLLFIELDRHTQPSRRGCHRWKLRRIDLLLFGDDLVLLTFPEQGLQHDRDRFSAANDHAGMKIIALKDRGIMSIKKPTPLRAASTWEYTAAGGEIQVPGGGTDEWRKEAFKHRKAVRF